MQNNLKKYCSIFFLLLFVFPLVERELHSIEHANDFHCNASDKHFHKQEHSCSICDYTSSDNFTSSQDNLEYVIAIKKYKFQSFYENVNIPTAFSDIPSRAPPIA